MITINNLLFELARSINNGSPEPDDSSIQVPDQISGIVSLRGVADQPQQTTSSTLNVSSFGVSSNMLVNSASGAISATIATIGKGLWEFNAYGSYSSNFQDVTNTFDHRIHLVWNSGIILLIGFKSSGATAAPVAQTGSRVLTLLIPVDGAILVQVANNNAAGQISNSVTSIFANRLL